MPGTVCREFPASVNYWVSLTPLELLWIRGRSPFGARFLKASHRPFVGLVVFHSDCFEEMVGDSTTMCMVG